MRTCQCRCGRLRFVPPEESKARRQRNVRLNRQTSAHAVKAPTAVLLDPTGALGHLYDAKTTPHMYILNPQGTLIYNGAIDDRATTDRANVNGAKNYVSLALGESLAGMPVSEPATRPYGCSVKYPD